MTSADLRFYFYLFCRRLPLMIVVGALVVGAGLAYTLSLPPVYRATSTLLVEAPLVANPLVPADPVGAPVRLQIIHQQLMTHASLVALAERHGLNNGPEPLSPEQLAEDLRGRIQLEPVSFGGNQNALGFSISFEAATPELAASVTNDLVSKVLARDLAERSSRATATLSFYQDEVDRLAVSVAAIEVRRQAYKTENLQALPDTLEFRRLLQINTRDRLLVLQREEVSLRARRASHLARDEVPLRLADAGPQTPAERQLAELWSVYDAQRLMFAADSPVLAGLRAQIADAEARVTGEGSAPSPDTMPSTFDVELADIDDRLQAVKVEQESLERTDAELAASIAATPANETALNALEREYTNAQSLYNAAVARLAEASTGEQISARFEDERLTLMEAALPPEQPVGPRRMRMALGSLAAGAIAALVAAVAIELLTWRVRRPIEIERKLGIEVIATIPYIPKRHLLADLRLPGRRHDNSGMVRT